MFPKTFLWITRSHIQYFAFCRRREHFPFPMEKSRGTEKGGEHGDDDDADRCRSGTCSAGNIFTCVNARQKFLAAGQTRAEGSKGWRKKLTHPGRIRKTRASDPDQSRWNLCAHALSDLCYSRISLSAILRSTCNLSISPSSRIQMVSVLRLKQKLFLGSRIGCTVFMGAQGCLDIYDY
jgi:hypothetical protein